MKSSSFLLLSGSLAVTVASCANHVTTGVAGGVGGGTGGSSSSTSSTSSTGTTIGTGGAVGTGGVTGTGGTTGSGGKNANDSCANATQINVNATLSENLPTGASDYYVFTGTKGEAINIEALADYLDSSDPQPYNPTYVDTVVSLYDSSNAKIAENDQIPNLGDDADLFTVLPADGTYCLRVTDCWVWTAESGKQCALPVAKTHTAYSLQIYEKDGTQANVVQVSIPSPGNTPSTATPIKFVKEQNSIYYERTDTFGFFTGAPDRDWFSFSLPADTPISGGGRSTAYLFPMLSGTTHDGSTEPLGLLTVWDATGTVVLARVDGAGGPGRIDVPVSLATPYLFSVDRADATIGSNDFFVLFFSGGAGSPLEQENHANDTLAGAEAMTGSAQPDGRIEYYIDGDLLPAGTDVDYFSAALPTNFPTSGTVSAGCDGLNYGSGLIGLTATLLDQNGHVLGASTEVQGESAYVEPLAVGSATSIYLEVSATSQDPTVTGTYYSCGVYFNP